MRRRKSFNIEGRQYGRRDDLGIARNAVAAGIQLDENPNRGKRHAAGLGFMDGRCADLQRAQCEAYSPLTVKTPLRDSRGRRNPRMGHTSYTV